MCIVVSIAVIINHTVKWSLRETLCIRAFDTGVAGQPATPLGLKYVGSTGDDYQQGATAKSGTEADDESCVSRCSGNRFCACAVSVPALKVNRLRQGAGMED